MKTNLELQNHDFPSQNDLGGDNLLEFVEQILDEEYVKVNSEITHALGLTALGELPFDNLQKRLLLSSPRRVDI